MDQVRILVVEEDEKTCSDIQARLIDLGYDVPVVVNTGKDAISMVEKLYPRMVIMDSALQGEINGIKAAEQIRRQFGIPVIYLTAQPDDTIAIEPFGYLIKPVEEQALAITIRMTLYKLSVDQNLTESEKRYREFFKTAMDCVFITTYDGKWVDFNDAAIDLFGYLDRKELLDVPIRSLYADPAERISHIQSICEKGYVLEYPVNLRRKDGTIFPALITSVVRKDNNGAIIGFQGTIRDISDKIITRDRINHLLERQEEQLRIINKSPAIAFLWRAEENWPVEMVTDNITQLGYVPDDFLSGVVVYSSLIHPDDLSRVADEVAYNSSHSINDFTQEYRIFGKDGSLYWVKDYTHIRRDKTDIITHFEGIILDISEQKRAQEALLDIETWNRDKLETLLRLSEMDSASDQEFLDVVFNAVCRLTKSPLAFFGTMTQDESVFTIVAWSPSVMEICSIDHAPLQFHIENSGIWAEAVRRRKPYLVNNYNVSLPGKKGLPFGHVPISRFISVPIFEGKQIVMVTAVANKETDYNTTDCTHLSLLMQGIWIHIRRRQIQKELKENEQKFHDIFNNTTDAIHIHEIREDGSPGRFIEVNDTACRMLGYTKEEMLKMIPSDITTSYHNPDLGQILKDQQVKGSARFETGHQRKDGIIIPVEVNTRIIALQGKKMVIGVIRDSTERKAAEELLKRFNEDLEEQVKIRTEQLTALLAEKEVLIREIHHRVRNSIQVISSLFYLQARGIQNETAKEILLESQNRIKSIALVYEKLYESPDLSKIEYAGYIRNITRYLFEVYHKNPDLITCKIQADNIYLTLDQAVPCSLLLNELITNSLKHGYKEKLQGTITITMKRDITTITTSYKDDGTGMPEHFDLHQGETVGMKLITGLVKQMNGSITLDQTEGTMFTITIPL